MDRLVTVYIGEPAQVHRAMSKILKWVALEGDNGWNEVYTIFAGSDTSIRKFVDTLDAKGGA